MDNKRVEEKISQHIDHEYTREIVCPYCGYVFSDSWDYGLETRPSEMECNNEDCLKTFDAYIDVDVTYITDRIEDRDE